MAIQDDANNSKFLKDNLKEADKVIKDINDSSADLRADFGAIKDIFKDLSKNSVFYSDELEAAVKSSGNLEKSAGVLAKFDKEHLKDKKELKKVEEEEKKVLKEITDLEAQRRTLTVKKLALDGKKDKASLAELRRINKALEVTGDTLDKAKQTAGFFEDIRKTNDELNKKTAFFDTLDKVFGKLPLVGPAFQEFAKASKEIRDNLGSGTLMAGLGALMQMLMKGSMLAVAKGLLSQNEQVTSIARNLNIARKEAVGFRDNLVDASLKSGKPVSFLLEGIDAVNESLGASGLISIDSAKQFSTLTHRLGLSAEEAANLFNAASATGTSFKDLNGTIIGNVKALNAANDSAIDYKQVMKDISGFSNATLLTQNKFAGGLAKAAYTARRLGLEMSTLENISGNLLDFETSIASELEAELLTGRQLNLETARLAALKGDLTKVGLELEKQGITSEKFGSMNVLQQEAIAKAMGMSREELGTMLARQEQLKVLAKELNIAGLQELDTEEQVAKIMEAKGVSRSDALSMLGQEEMAQQQLNVDAATAMKETATTLAEAIKGDALQEVITAPLQTMQGYMTTMRNLMYGLAAAGALYYSGIGGKLMSGAGKLFKGGGPKVASTLAKTGGITKFVDSKGVTRFRDASGKFVKGPASTAAKVGTNLADDAIKGTTKTIAKTTTKVGAKSLGKSMLKKVPVIGALAGIGFGISRAMKGDFLGAAGEVASGAASLIPGFGTAASVAIDAGLAARDIYKGTSRSDESITQAASDASTKSEKAAKTQEELLKENKKLTLMMERMLQRETNILMDGAKVGSQIFKSTYKNSG